MTMSPRVAIGLPARDARAAVASSGGAGDRFAGMSPGRARGEMFRVAKTCAGIEDDPTTRVAKAGDATTRRERRFAATSSCARNRAVRMRVAKNRVAKNRVAKNRVANRALRPKVGKVRRPRRLRAKSVRVVTGAGAASGGRHPLPEIRRASCAAIVLRAGSAGPRLHPIGVRDPHVDATRALPAEAVADGPRGRVVGDAVPNRRAVVVTPDATSVHGEVPPRHSPIIRRSPPPRS